MADYQGSATGAQIDATVTKVATIEANADVTANNETSHADVLVDGDFSGSSGFMKTDGSGGYSIDTTTYLVTETSHDDVLVDGDFASQGLMTRGASSGTYSITSAPTGTIVGTTDTQTLSNKTLTDYKETLYTTTTTGNVTIDLANGNVQRYILDANRQFTMPADPGAFGQSFVLIIECATFTPTWNTTPVIEWLTIDGAAPTLVTDAGLVNVVTFVWDDVDSRWLGFLGGSETA